MTHGSFKGDMTSAAKVLETLLGSTIISLGRCFRDADVRANISESGRPPVASLQA